MFKKMFCFIKQLFAREKDNEDYSRYSKFKVFLDGVKKTDSQYTCISTAVDLCDEALRIAKNRVSLVNKIKSMDDTLSELACFNELTEEDIKKLKNLLERFISLTKERNTLRNQITGFDNSLVHLMKVVDDAKFAVDNIAHAEKKQRIFRHDIGYLQGEKSDLEHERSALKNGLSFINKFTTVMTLIFVSIALFLVYSFVLNKNSIFVPTAILTIMVIIVGALVLIFRRRVVFELHLNLKKQQRIIGVLNKKSVVYAYYTNFLGFEYKKYKINNSKALKANLKNYETYKHLSSRIDAIRNILYETERQIEIFLRDKKIVNKNTTIEQFARTLNIEDKRAYYNELLHRKKTAEENLLELDTRHLEVWEGLEALKEGDQSEDRIINTMIKMYFSEVDKIVSTSDEIDGIDEINENHEIIEENIRKNNEKELAIS